MTNYSFKFKMIKIMLQFIEFFWKSDWI